MDSQIVTQSNTAETFMPQTGFLDRYGAPICEGDLVICRERHPVFRWIAVNLGPLFPSRLVRWFGCFGRRNGRAWLGVITRDALNSQWVFQSINRGTWIHDYWAQELEIVKLPLDKKGHHHENSDSTTPKISIVIPTYTRHDKLAECLASIRNYTNSDSCEVIVSANGADRATLDVFNEFQSQWQGSSHLLWSDEPLGFPKACNAGIRASQAEYVILLNDDVILLEQPKNLWLDQLLEPFADPKMGITGTLKQFCPSAQREFLLFFCVVIRKKMMDEIGVLDEIFGVGAGEDCDLCCRAVDRGWKIQAVPDEPPIYSDRGDSSLPSHQQGQWVTTSPIYHLGGATVGNVEGFQEIFHRNSEILKRRYGVNIERAKTIEGWMLDSELEWLARQAKNGTRILS